MRKSALITLLVFIASLGFAQRNVDFSHIKRMPIKQNVLKKVKGHSRTAATTTMSKAPRKAASLVEPPLGKEAEQWYIADGHFIMWDDANDNQIDAIDQWLSIGVIIDGNDIYLQGFDYWFPEAWVKGTISGSTVTIPSGQLVGSDEYGEEYIVGYDVTSNGIADLIFTYDSEKGTLTLDPNVFILEDPYQDKPNYYGYWYELALTKEAPAAPELVTPPAGEEEDWNVLGAEVTVDEKEGFVFGDPEQYPVKVIKDGNDFYIQGLCKDFSEAWVKGTIADGKVSFATGQYLGVYTETDEESGEENQFDMFFVGESAESAGIGDLVFTYDEENNTLTNETSLMVISVKPSSVSMYLYLYMPAQITKIVEPIAFADANVKQLCVQNWDTDGDGELSEAEAAAVTDLGNVFTRNADIKSFNELQYFTGLTSVGDEAFLFCSGLTSLTIPNSVTNIGDDAFSDCSGLTSVTIPNSVTSIGQGAFRWCSSLTSLIIGNSVTNIGWIAFGACEGLTSIVVESGNTVYDSRGNCNAIISTSDNKLVVGCQSTVIPNSVTSIGAGAFYRCFSLTSITIPNSVTSIEHAAFADCSGLTSVTIPNSVTSIGDYAFNGCSGLTSIVVESGNSVYDSRGNCNAIIETSTNTLIAGCQNTVIPNSVTSIGNYAFHYCTGLTSVTIPNSVTNIGWEAFQGCTSLTEIISEIESPFEIDESVFSEETYSQAQLTVPAGTKSAYQSKFPWNKFTNIVEAKRRASLSVPEFSVHQGEGEQLSINMDNEDEIIMAEFYMQLPEGLHIATDADGYYEATLGGRTDRTHTLEVTLGSDGLYHFLAYSTKNKPFLGTEGELLSVNITCDESVEAGTWQGTLTNILMSNADKQAIEQPDITFDIEVTDYLLGDVNHDRRINGMDIVEMVELIMNRQYERAGDLYPSGNPDGVINGMDLVEEVELVMSQTAGNHAPALTARTERLTMKSERSGVKSLGILSDRPFILAQMTVELSEGMTLSSITSDRRHEVAFRQTGDNKYVVVCYSNRNESFEANGKALEFHCLGDGGIRVSDVLLIDADKQECLGTDAQSGDVTGIDTIDNGQLTIDNADVYDLNGRKIEGSTFKAQSSKLQKGVYIINNQKVTIK